VASVDVKKDMFGSYSAYIHSGKKRIKEKLLTFVKNIEQMGAGEIILTAINREGTFKGYDTDLIRQVSDTVDIPVVANGGAAGIGDFEKAVNRGGASAVAAGSIFVYKSENRGVLINYPGQNALKKDFFDKIV
jgi:cyclase